LTEKVSRDYAKGDVRHNAFHFAPSYFFLASVGARE
jgi:hypothetical protein